MDLPRGPEREIVRERKRSYELNGQESDALATIAAFRVVQVSDVQEILGQERGEQSVQKSLDHLQASGMLERIPLERRDNDVVVLTDRGRDLLEANRREHAGEPRQAFYAGLKKPRELTHDAQVYRASRDVEAQIRDQGGRVQRVILDYELKREYQHFLQERNRGRADSTGRPDRTPEEIAAWAKDHDLPCDGNRVRFPDARIEFEDRDQQEQHRDVEVVTPHYRGAHAAAVARSGFQCYRGGLRLQTSGRRGGRGLDPRLAEEIRSDPVSLLRFRDVVAERAICLEPLGFTERQSRFLATVMAHSGVFLERQYCCFAGIAHGQKSHDFIGRLVDRGFARVETTSHLYQGRFYHLHHKRLYSLLGQTDNRNRKRAHRSRMIERLMLLDIVLDDRDVLWLGTESDKVRYFEERLAQYRLTLSELPHLTFGSGSNQVLRPFADKLPIGVDPLRDQYVFTYLVTRSSPREFRSFLIRHYTLMRSLLRWTLRVFVPRKFEKAIPTLRHTLDEEFKRPLRPSDGEELLWFFRQRREATRQPAFVPDARYLEAAKQFSAPRFAVLEKVWRLHGDDVIWNTYSKGIEDQFEIGRAAVEFTVIQRQYLHLAHLVGVA